jgi:hypothetical protein
MTDMSDALADVRAYQQRRRTFDPKCHTLAASFLSDHDGIDTAENQDALAAEIQRLMDEWIAERQAGVQS